MRCYECKVKLEKKYGQLDLNRKGIGDFKVNKAHYFICPSCQATSFPVETIVLIEKEENKIKNEMLGRHPIAEYITSVEACEILNISKQAFHKNKRIKKGFIYSFNCKGKKLYLKKSVLLFKKNGDGRFSLSEIIAQAENTYLKDIKRSISESLYKNIAIEDLPLLQDIATYSEVKSLSQNNWN